MSNNLINTLIGSRFALHRDYLNGLVDIAENMSFEALLSADRIDYIKQTYQIDNGVAIINVDGVIFPKTDVLCWLFGGTSISFLTSQIIDALDSKDVKSILLNINSPGGSIDGVHELCNFIYKNRDVKPITSYVSSMCCSAGYWIASSTSSITADRTATLGSIGVLATAYDDSEYLKKEGFKKIVIVSSKSPNKRLDLNTEEGQSALMKELDGLCDIFHECVARNRGQTVKYVETNFGAGGTMLGDEAVSVGLIDSIGSLDKAIKSSPKQKTNYGGIKVMATEEKPKDNDAVLEEDKKDDEEETAEGKNKKKSDKKSEKDDEKDEDKEKDAKNDLKTRKAQLLVNDTELFQAIRNEGVIAERERIEAINKFAIVYGENEIIKSARLTDISKGDLAIKLIEQENSKRETHFENYKADAETIPVIPRVVVDLPESNIENDIKKYTAVYRNSGGTQ